jgi:hypothetical protein
VDDERCRSFHWWQIVFVEFDEDAFTWTHFRGLHHGEMIALVDPRETA